MTRYNEINNPFLLKNQSCLVFAELKTQVSFPHHLSFVCLSFNILKYFYLLHSKWTIFDLTWEKAGFKGHSPFQGEIIAKEIEKEH